MKHLLILIIAFGIAASVSATTIHVPLDQPTIQGAIDVAADGDTVLVAPGTYVESIDLLNRSGLVLRSESGSGGTVLRAVSNSSTIVTISNQLDSTSVIDGFSIRNASSGTGLYCSGSPTIRNCRVDSCGTGIRLKYSIAKLLYNQICNNGVGIECSDGGSGGVAEVAFNQVVGNLGNGIIMSWQRAYTHHNVICNNGSYGILSYVYNQQIVNNTIAGNLYGIGSYNGGHSILNNIVVSNQLLGIDAPSSTIAYNDVWNNGSQNNPGVGGISTDPLFTDQITGNYALQSTSPCIDAGDPNPIYNDPDGTRNDMGAYPKLQTVYPYVSSLNVVGESQFNVVSNQPTFSWTFYSPGGTALHQSEIEFGTDANWDNAELWDPAPIAGPAAQLVYSGVALTDGQLCYVRLRVEDSAGWSLWYNSTFRMNSVPHLPTLISPNATIVGNHPVLTIQNATDPEGDPLKYDFEIYSDSALSTLVISQANQPQTSGQTSYTVSTALPDNLRYWWRARAFDSFEHSAWTSANSFWVDAVPEPPAAPVLTEPPPPDGKPVFTVLPTLKWAASADPDPFDTVHYKLELSIRSNFSMKMVVDSIAANSLTLADSLDFGAHYWWRVTAKDKTGLTAISMVKDFWTWIPGDADHSHSVDISDLMAAVDFLISGVPITPLFVADFNGDCTVDISDVMYMVDYLTGVGPAAKEECAQ